MKQKKLKKIKGKERWKGRQTIFFFINIGYPPTFKPYEKGIYNGKQESNITSLF